MLPYPPTVGGTAPGEENLFVLSRLGGLVLLFLARFCAM